MSSLGPAEICPLFSFFICSYTLVGSGLKNRRHGLLFLEVQDKVGFVVREGITTQAVCKEVAVVQ